MSGSTHSSATSKEEKGSGAAVSPPTLLLVGADEGLATLVNRVIDRDRARVVEVGDYFSAMGELTGEPRPAALIGRVMDLDAQELTEAAESLRRVAPETEMVLLAPADRAGDAADAVKAGFDRCLIEPVTADDLLRAVQGSARLAPSAAGGKTSTAAGLSAAVNDAELGDVDLVDAAIRDRRNVPALAMRMVAARSGLAGIALSGKREQVPAGHVHVSVEYEGRLLGVLHAPPPATVEALVPWADWLGHWMALVGHLSETWDMAMRDELTGAWNRRFFVRFLGDVIKRAAAERFRVTLMLFDIDDFKTYNDRFGHAAGDEILRETYKLMQSVVREHDVVARIGGDEFAVIFWDASGPRRPNSDHPHDVENAARRFQEAICNHKFPKLLSDAPGSLTISGGLAGFPWDGRTPQQLLEKADAMAMLSKRQGKNALSFGPGAKCDVEPST